MLIEGMGDYVKFHLTSGNLVNKRTLREWEDSLPAAEFVRVHRSYLVPWKKIESVEGSEIRIQNRKVPIGRAYRAQLMEMLNVR
ncbi:LytTR family transcriptional regulator [Opitutaceae bacterium]|nr:LytTR family transcriptional regulator [Opitutaceae bacterium]